MLVSLIDTLDIRAILLSNNYGPKLSSNFNYRKKNTNNTETIQLYIFSASQPPRSLLWATVAGELSQCYHCILVPCSIWRSPRASQQCWVAKASQVPSAIWANNFSILMKCFNQWATTSTENWLHHGNFSWLFRWVIIIICIQGTYKFCFWFYWETDRAYRAGNKTETCSDLKIHCEIPKNYANTVYTFKMNDISF